MPTPQTQTLTVASVARLGHSVNGNPSFTVTFTNGLVARTQSDASISYGINNPEWRDVPLLVTFTRSGRIAYWERATDANTNGERDSRIMRYLPENEAHDMFNDFLDEIGEDVTILGMSYAPSTVLREVDPIAYRCTFSDWLAGENLTTDEDEDEDEDD